MTRLWFSSTLLPALALALSAGAEDLPPLKRSDVIFQNSRSAQSLAILLATDSPFTHVGIVDFDDDGNPVVLEAVRTTRATPLQDWVDQGEGGDVAIYRMQDLTDDQAQAVTKAARSHFGKGYDPYFYRSEETLYCSELVHIAFRDGIGAELGRVQTLGALNLDSAAVRVLIEERWQTHPACADGQAEDADACLALIRDEPLVTPQAVAEDGRLKEVYSSFGD
ncbi:MAG: YiiX/YebB-like N1pC/P60 family cysteine hydrolase [Tabrizicola sp.]|uniref:YiiX/YebB-like N1pC/P60 family cysteine hydrolase n=1 Tax=Tabrizicola sp. TaxID=2005166 RepID=UPI002AB97FC9|nr:YiiX/YebB-like N1pC/P60 family cysteine hydrolase [Tabrizicola sp.]MDZ4086671.1 YiiX/YebB-like N1pC/P60 family cysteine hydrolase [Tabrizicola sp.]